MVATCTATPVETELYVKLASTELAFWSHVARLQVIMPELTPTEVQATEPGFPMLKYKVAVAEAASGIPVAGQVSEVVAQV